jgi:hypothetical protein
LIHSDGQARTTISQTLQMSIQQQRLSGLDGDSLEQTIAVGQAAIF